MERVAERRGVDLEQSGPGEGPACLKPDDPVDAADADPPQDEPLDGRRTVEAGRLRASGSMGRQDPDAVAGFQPPGGVDDRGEAGLVEPAQVVDGHEDAAVTRRKRTQRHEGAAGHGSLVDRQIARALDAHRDRERSRLRRWKGGPHIGEVGAEEVDEPGVGQPRLGLDRSARDDARSVPPEAVSRRAPDGRLAGAGRALEQEDGRSVAPEPAQDPGDLGATPDDLALVNGSGAALNCGRATSSPALARVPHWSRSLRVLAPMTTAGAAPCVTRPPAERYLVMSITQKRLPSGSARIT